MNKLILVVAYFLCYAAFAEESLYDEEVGTFSYLVQFLQFPLSLISRDKHFEDTEIATIPDGDHSSEEGSEILSFIERLLLFPVCLVQECDCNRVDGLQICKIGTDSYLLEYVIGKGERALNEIKTKILETCSLCDWKNILHDLKTKLQNTVYSSSIMSWLKSQTCHPETAIPDAYGIMTHIERCTVPGVADGMARIWSSIGPVFTVTKWAIIRYVIAGILALSLLQSVMKIDKREVTRLAKRFLSFFNGSCSLIGRYRPSLSPIAEDPSDACLSAMIQSVYNFVSKAFERSTPPAKFMQTEHYPMCEYFDTKMCNCGGKSSCREKSSELRHLKMCEFFDFLPCNCGGVDYETTTDLETYADISTELAESETNDTCFCDVTGVQKECLATKEQSVQAVSYVTESNVNDEEMEKMTNCKKQNIKADPYMESSIESTEGVLRTSMEQSVQTDHFVKSSTDSTEGVLRSNKEKIAQIDPYEKSSIAGAVGVASSTKEKRNKANRYVSLSDTSLMTVVGTNEVPEDHEHVPQLLYLPIDHHLVCQGSDSEPHRSEKKSNAKADGNLLMLCPAKDLNVVSSSPLSSCTTQCVSDTPSDFSSKQAMRCSHCIKKFVECFEKELKSDTSKKLNVTVRPLKMNEEFVNRLNTLLSDGYKIRYFYANRYMGNPLPKISNHTRYVSKPLRNDFENNKKFESPELEMSECKISLDSNHDLADSPKYDKQISPKKVQFVDHILKIGDSEPKYLNYVNDGERLSEYSDDSAGSHESHFDVEEPVFLDIDSYHDGKGGIYPDISTEIGECQHITKESHHDYLEDTESDIGSPRHNSSFKDNSPYTTADSVSFADLRGCGDGLIYSTLTRRTPFAEVGLGDLSADMSVRESEGSILDVSDISTSMSFNKDTGILEVAAVFAAQSMWRLAKRFWQKNLNSTSAVAIKEKENGLFFIRQKNNYKRLKPRTLSTNSSSSNIEYNEDELVDNICEFTNAINKEKDTVSRNSTRENDFDTSYNCNQPKQKELNNSNDVWVRMQPSPNLLEMDLDLSVIHNDNNNARFYRKKRNSLKEKSDGENSSSCEQWDYSDHDKRSRGPVIYKSRRASCKYSSTKHDRGYTSRYCSTSCYSRRRACTCKKRTNQLNLPFSRQKGIKSRLKRARRDFSFQCEGDPSQLHDSIQHLSLTSNKSHENLQSSESSSDRSGNFADESSSSSSDDSEIRNTLSKLEINDVASSKPLKCGSNEMLEKAISSDNKALLMQKNENACTCKDCRSNDSQLQDILSQLRSLHCNVWELKNFKHINENDNESKVLAWAWSCVEKYD